MKTILLIVGLAATTAFAQTRSPLDVRWLGAQTVLVSDHTAGVAYFVDAAAGKVAREVKLTGKPFGVAGNFVAEMEAGTVAELDAAGAVTLRDLNPATGWFGDAKTFAVAPAAAAKTDPATASWLSSGYVARLWRLLNTQPAGRLTAADLLDGIEPRKE
jgi:hypothetical protein